MAVLMKLQHSMGIATTSVKLVVLLVMVAGFVVKADVNEDKKECTNQLVALSTCLPYVGGTAKAPTPDCCKGLEQVLSSSKKCLCTLIKDRNDPGLGLQFNASLALNLPSLCKSPVSLTDCPALLHMDPKSKEAQIFYEFDKSLHSNSSQPPVAANNTGMKPSANVKNDGGITISMSGILLFCLSSLLIVCI